MYMALTERELEIRRKALGASEIGVLTAAVEGRQQMYRNLSPFSVWDYHVYGTRSELGASADAGSAFESGIGELYLRRVGEDDIRLWKARRRVHPTDRWRSATPDYYVVAGGSMRRILECKWVGPGQEHHWDWGDPEGVPRQYRDQVDWQMDVAQAGEADLAAFFASSRELHIWRFSAQEKRAKWLVDIGKEFWFNHVVPAVAPPIDYSDACSKYLADKHSDPKPEMVTAPAEAESWARQYTEATATIKESDAAKKEARNQLCALIGDDAGIRAPWGKATWKKNKSGKPDWKAIAQEYRNMVELLHHPGDCEDMKGDLDSVIERNTPEGSRVLRCSFEE
jgi:predicted phage-related endonuclease